MYIYHMRKLLVALMMLVMLAPSLACAMPVCGTHIAAQVASMPCADHADGMGAQASQTEHADQKLMLLKDCMGVDLQVAESVHIDKPDVHSPVSVFALNNDLSVMMGIARESDAIRGPPPDWPVAHSTQPPVILSTQRFRI